MNTSERLTQEMYFSVWIRVPAGRVYSGVSCSVLQVAVTLLCAHVVLHVCLPRERLLWGGLLKRTLSH